MDWKYRTWPRLNVPMVHGGLIGPPGVGWSLEQVTREHAQMACAALDIHYKCQRALEDAPATPEASPAAAGGARRRRRRWRGHRGRRARG
eukprot:9236948-Alexandrium_andersonii.AAC.1